MLLSQASPGMCLAQHRWDAPPLSPEKSFTTPLMVQVLVDNPAELEKIRERESDITKERIQKVLDAGANVVLTTKGIDDMSLKYFVEAGVIACRRVPKDDLR